TGYLEFDSHGTGSMAQNHIFSSMYRGLSAGLLELIQVLKSNGLFEDSLIQIVGDFGRSPRADGSGSDHGFNGMVSSLYSGAFSGGAKIIGNIRKDVSSLHVPTTYPGTWGERATTQINSKYGSQTIKPSPLHLASTVLELL